MEDHMSQDTSVHAVQEDIVQHVDERPEKPRPGEQTLEIDPVEGNEKPEVSIVPQSLPIVEISADADGEDTFPEGGPRAWSVVLGAFFLLFPSFGLQVSIGTLQDYWAQNQLSSYSASAVGWIASVFVYLGLALGLWVGPLFDRYGPRYIALVGSVQYTVMIFLLAECSTYWQFMLCCGLFGGTAAALLTTTSLAAVSHWFKARRGLAQGIAMIGSSFGGLTIPLILRTTFAKYGYAWSIRILGFLFLGCFVIGNLFLRARIKPSTSQKKSIFKWSVFKDPRFCFLTVTIFGIEVVLFGALGILPTYATLGTDFPADTGFYLISILNGCSCIGRLLPGYAADKYGRFNVLLVMIIFTLVAMLVIWLPFGARSMPALYAFAAIFGFGTGSWMALVPPCIGQLCRADEFGTYFGSCYFLAGLSLLICIPVSGELIQVAGPQAMVGFSCAVLAMSLLTFTASRWACLGWNWSWSAKV